MVKLLALSGIAFGQNIVGIITRPYETYRRIVNKGSLWETVYIGICLALYFLTAAMVKTSLFRPFLMTRQFFLLATAAIATFLLAVFLFWQVGHLFGAKENSRGFILGWAYSLVPTLVWFLMTSLLFVALPPPRTTSIPGVMFSIVYLLISATLLFWKMILAFLSLRFGLRLDLGRIIAVCAIVLPILGAYSFGMYRLGIFRIPFI
jgi:cation transporter-like permease